MVRWSLLFVVAAVSAAPSLAAADMIVLESYVGKKPTDIDAVIVPLVDEARQQGLIAGEPLSGQVDALISLAAPILGAAELAEVQRWIDDGVSQYREGQYEAAIGELQRGIDALARAPATMVVNQSTRDLMLEGLIYLSQANGRLGRSVPATQAMAELIRSFPDKEISNAKHGPEPRKLFREVKADLASRGVGRLKVTVDDAKTVIFVNERYAGVGEVVVDGLLPGKYRVFVQQADRHGRLHEVDVEPGAEGSLAVTWGVDSTLRNQSGFVGLVFEDEAAQTEMEAVYAIRVARALRATGVAVVGVRDYRGRRSLVGTLYALDSTKPIRNAALSLEPVEPTEQKVRAMGRFLAGDEAAGKLFANLAHADKTETVTAKAGRRDRRDTSRPFRTWKWIGLIGGGLALGTGITLIAIHQEDRSDDSRPAFTRDTRTTGIITAAAGGVLTLAGVYFWVRDGRDARRRSVALVPLAGGGMVALGGGF